MKPPTVAGWNLVVRFGLEVAALTGFAIAGWRLGGATTRWLLVVLAPVAAATVWALFNVPGDPSRSGAAPIVVPGWIRLALELLVLTGGVATLALTGRPIVPLAIVALIVAHYAASWSRIGWLLEN